MLSPAAPVRDIVAALPGSLSRFGESVTLRLSGNPHGPLRVLLGGISGDRFAAIGADGGPGWWDGMAGAGAAADPSRHRIAGLDYGADPEGRLAPSTADQARILAVALDAAGIAHADAIVGASYGGMVALAFAELFPRRIGRLVVISADASPHPAATAGRQIQRRIVALGLGAGQGGEALALARGLAMLSYRTPEELDQRFAGGTEGDGTLAPSAPGRYLEARGEAYRAVMTPERFLSLSASIDRHRIDPARIAAPALLIGARSDRLIPADRMRTLAEALAGPASLQLRDCLEGHDMFLKQAGALGALAAPFLEEAR